MSDFVSWSHDRRKYTEISVKFHIATNMNFSWYCPLKATPRAERITNDWHNILEAQVELIKNITPIVQSNLRTEKI